MTKNLPALPLVDSCFFVDNSTIEGFTTCPRSTEYSKLHKRTIADRKSALNFGSCIHNALEHRYRTNGSLPPDYSMENEQAHLIAKYFAENPTTIDDYRNANYAATIMRAYNARYLNEPFKVLRDAADKPLVELSFSLPIGTVNDINIIYTGRVDLAIEQEQGIFIVDHKTTSMLGQQFFDELSMSAQQLGYCWAFSQMAALPIRGFIINALRIRPPAKSRGLVQDDDFQRNATYLRPGQLDEWKTNLIALVEEFFWHYNRDYMPMKTKWCCGKYGKCQYFDVCSLPPSQRLPRLQSGQFQDNNWSPLKH